MKSSQQNTKIEHIHSRAIVPDPVLHVGEGRLRVESSSVSDEVEWNNLWVAETHVISTWETSSFIAWSHLDRWKPNK